MDLCLLYKNNRFPCTSIYTPDISFLVEYGYIKVVACPFCGISTSNGEKLTVTIPRDFLLFRCLTCQKAAFSVIHAEVITKKEVEEVHPYNTITDDVGCYSVKLCKIISVSANILRNFYTTLDVPNTDVIAFYKNIETFTYENKADINNHIDADAANKFLKGNKLAEKYNIKYRWRAGDKVRQDYPDVGILGLSIDGYCLSDFTLRGEIIVDIMIENNVIRTSVDYIS